MKKITLICTILLLFAIYCSTQPEQIKIEQGDRKDIALKQKEHSSTTNDNIFSIKTKRFELNDVEFNNYLTKRVGMKRVQVPEEFKMENGEDTTNDYVIMNRVYQKDDYIYFDVALKADALAEVDIVEFSHDNHEVYMTDYFYSQEIQPVNNSGNPNTYKIIKPTDEIWFGILAKKREQQKNKSDATANTFILNLKREADKYFWRYTNTALFPQK